MTAAKIRLLLLEDNPGDARLVKTALAEQAPGEFVVTTAERLADALTRIQAERFDAVLCDLGLPDSVGLGTAQAIVAHAPVLPLVVLTGTNDLDLGRAAIKLGAQDYLVKGDLKPPMISRTIRYAIERKRLEIELRRANETLERRVAERTADLEAALREARDNTERYRTLTESAMDAIVTVDGQQNIALFNAAAERMFGYSAAEVIGQQVERLMPESFRAAHRDHIRKLHSGISAMGRNAAVLALRADGTRFPAEVSISKIEIAQGTFYTAILRDITDRRRHEQELARQKDLYAALSQTNQTIVRGISREELFQSVCRIAVEQARFLFSWIALIDKDDPWLTPVATYGDDAGYMAELHAAMSDRSAPTRGLSWAAIESATHTVANDFLTYTETRPWHEAARRCGVRAFAAFPLRQAGEVIGVFNVYADTPGVFTDDLLATLDEMAIDVSFALDNLVREAERTRIEKALLAAEEKFRGLVEQSIAGIYIIQDGKFVYANPRFAEIVGYGSADELIGTDPLRWVAEEDHAKAAENLRRLNEGEAQSAAIDFRLLRQDGVTIEVGANAARATHEGRPAIIGLMQDISEKKRAAEEIQRYVEQLKTAFMSTVEVATTLSEMRDPYTAGHERRVAEIAAAIGAELGFDERRQEGLRVAGHLHDVGKITIPSEILSKPGKLSPIELKLIQGHAQASYDVLKDVEFPWPVAQVALQHHERIDGRGYPQGLKGEAILLEARIMAVADVVEAMSSHRPYRAGLGIEAALAEIERGRGSAYDPVIADACLKLFRNQGYTIPA